MEQTFFQTIILSLKVALLSCALNLPGALWLAWKSAFNKQKIWTVLDVLANLPMVLPPVITGYILLWSFGRRSFVGGFLFNLWGVRLSFTFWAALLAAMTVSFPLVYRSIKLSMSMLDKELLLSASSLGADKREVLFRIILPLIKPGITNGLILGFARSLGEFGASITFAGNIAGETRTIPLAIYTHLQVPGEEIRATALVLFSLILSLSTMLITYRNGLVQRSYNGT
ncbi:MAG: molybdate ABC transporter permease subunit [Spirochaetales bacterium]|nr:molybdate ABC transporter permease subunit [Spirochaetales bacterium]